MQLLFIDFETFYDLKDYTLKSLSYEEYIRDPRFTVHALSVASMGGEIKAFANVGSDRAVDRVVQQLAPLIARPDVYTVAQNNKFDASILGLHYGLKVAKPLCTRTLARWAGLSRIERESLASMAKFFGLSEKGGFLENMSGVRDLSSLPKEQLDRYLEYNKHDVYLLREIFKKLCSIFSDGRHGDYKKVFDFGSLSVRTYCNPSFEGDLDLACDYEAQLIQKQEEAHIEVSKLFKFDTLQDMLKAVRSKNTFVKMCEELGGQGIVPRKVSFQQTKTARKKAQAAGDPDWKKIQVMDWALAKTDLEFMNLQNHPDERIATLARTRAGLNSSQNLGRCRRFIKIFPRGKVCVNLEPFYAHTGRFTTSQSGSSESASDGTNFQNLGKRSGDKTLRYMLRAPEGYKVVAGDSSQVEARTGAWTCRQNDLVERFRNNEDPYSELASHIFSVPYEQIVYYVKGDGAKLDKSAHQTHTRYRNVGKEGILSSQYQVGADKFSDRLLQQRIKLAENVDDHKALAKQALGIYREKNYHIVQFWDVCQSVLGALCAGEHGWFGGPDGKVFEYDGSADLFGHKVPSIRLPNGYWLRYPNLRWEYDEEYEKYSFFYDQLYEGKKSLYGGALFNNLNQGTAFGILADQALEINPQFRIVLNVHDEYSSIVPDADVERALKLYETALSRPPEWGPDIPVACEVSYGQTYGHVG